MHAHSHTHRLVVLQEDQVLTDKAAAQTAWQRQQQPRIKQRHGQHRGDLGEYWRERSGCVGVGVGVGALSGDSGGGGDGGDGWQAQAYAPAAAQAKGCCYINAAQRTI